MITNADLTLYNTYYNRETGLTEYHRTVIRGVNWQGAQKSDMYQLTGGTGLQPLQKKTSESVGSHQVSYESNTKEVETLYYRAAKEYLANTGLMYRGG